MEWNSVRKALACFAAVAFIVTVAGSASAAMTKEDAGCRAAIQKNAGKLGATAMKTMAGCMGSLVGGKIPASTVCNSIAGADSKAKVSGAAAKVRVEAKVVQFT